MVFMMYRLYFCSIEMQLWERTSLCSCSFRNVASVSVVGNRSEVVGKNTKELRGNVLLSSILCW